ncbi:bifunctional 5,10-methylenetetrahydrofolate dehydrogenase/5,10-methenyltetrahydrofolate cyclohydrolase [Convivina praedatoris]|uniref:Bifunctional protein FolD n=1 Tax=Convivina praedatoris TaxID=2880963 RepID=A0ABN8H7U8_9LACO|nr:bifunctional 5,10-methylenetetrahydrofolate dehydrogenase/5,10-methenyltetrahydrofolate cyclohydrolase [Convivina sp. LMG 32447]CAH1850104.1 Bifunctional protein FolD protein [Convivina sp. LMG 32447]CAH1851082.1 Bifunctional protein FolD protein [Convivina sp. LMG 32447]CAH1851094.1 Bifunctional protein FolD protein [Convivina sp. LMG 32447]
MSKILDGKALAQIINEQTSQAVKQLAKPVCLAVVYDPENAGSDLYVGMKARQAAKVGIETKDIPVPADATTESVQEIVRNLNQDHTITGILIQSPLPEAVNEQIIFSTVEPNKDVDGLGAVNQGLLFEDSPLPYTVAATPQGVMTLLKHYQIDLVGKTALVIGRSQLFGRPMAALLNNADATVILSHRYTPAEKLKSFLKQADLVVVGVGQPDFLLGEDLKPGCVVIDVGMNVVDGKATGDVDYSSASQVADYITPVPGGVGPMTIATLLENTVKAAQQNN